MSVPSPARPWLTLAARLGLGGILIVAGMAKARDLDGSVRAVRAYRLLPQAVAGPFGYGLPMIEIALGVLLVIGLGTRFVAVVAGVLLVAFVIGIASVWARGLSIDCGCFGGGGDVAPGQARYVPELLRDVGLIALAAGLAAWPGSRLSADAALGLTPSEESP